MYMWQRETDEQEMAQLCALLGVGR